VEDRIKAFPGLKFSKKKVFNFPGFFVRKPLQDVFQPSKGIKHKRREGSRKQGPQRREGKTFSG
jgi:hypothetical protein